MSSHDFVLFGLQIATMLAFACSLASRCEGAVNRRWWAR